MEIDESYQFRKIMTKCAYQLFLILIFIGILAGIVKIGIIYSATLLSGVAFINDLLLPIKYFIQNNIVYFYLACFSLSAWLACVFYKIPKSYDKSMRQLFVISVINYIFAMIITMCWASTLTDNPFVMTLCFIMLSILGFATLGALYDFIVISFKESQKKKAKDKTIE
jgi:hypothetical protein